MKNKRRVFQNLFGMWVFIDFFNKWSSDLLEKLEKGSETISTVIGLLAEQQSSFLAPEPLESFDETLNEIFKFRNGMLMRDNEKQMNALIATVDDKLSSITTLLRRLSLSIKKKPYDT